MEPTTPATATTPAQPVETAELVPTDAIPAQVEAAAAADALAAPAPASVNVSVTTAAAAPVILQVNQRGFFVRALWYLFVGWWLSGIMMFVAGLCIGSIVLLPAGLALVNRLPQVLTLRPRSVAVQAKALGDGSTQYTVGNAQQRNILLRTVYFLCFGLWAGMFVMFAAWVLSVLVVTLPLGLMLLNRVPAVLTLRRN